MNGYCDKCGKLIINDACVYDLVNGKIVGMLCLDCDEERERSKSEDQDRVFRMGHARLDPDHGHGSEVSSMS